jgi:hypothetical protein
LVAAAARRWTTDVELEALAATFGKVDAIKFFEEKSNGKSKARETSTRRAAHA